jgi:diguanylate cyclase (GGDEF)-like protein
MTELTRASTMLLALLIVHLVLGSLSLVVGRGMERPLALRLWGAGLLTYAVGLLVALPDDLPHGVNKLAGAAIVGIAVMLNTSGLLRNSSYRLSRTWIGAAYVAAVLLLVGNHLRPDYSVAFDFLAPAAFPNGLFLFAAFALFRAPTPEAKTACRFLGGILIFCVVVWLLRISFVLYSLGGTNDRDRMDLVISLFAIAQIIVAVSATIGLFWVEVRKMETTLRWIAGTDALTGLPNRRATLLRFQEEAARGLRHRRPYSLIVFDIDHFKKVNDAHGHAFGDDVLKQVSRALLEGKREVDVVGRFGGEEFVIVLSEEGPAGAAVQAKALHQRVKSVATPDSGDIPLTLSGGVASAPDDGSTWEELFAAADRRLYEAKRSGRDKVVCVD